MSFDIAAVRGNFPALKQKQVFFDNAGGSQTLGTVIESIHDYLLNSNVQLGGSYNVGEKANEKYASGYEAAAKYINTSPDNIVLGSSTTQLFRNLSYALTFPPGSELVLSSIDHEANIASWLALASRSSLTIKWWTPTSKLNPKLEISTLKPLLSEKTVLVACTHVSNILGTIHDIKGIAEAVHEVKGAMLVVDAVAYAPHRLIDVQDLGADFYAFSWYKVYGPHISMLYASPTALPKVESLGHYFNYSTTLSEKLGLAGASYELLASLPSVLSYFGPDLAATWAGIKAHEAVLQQTLLEYLNGRKDITILGETSADPEKRVCTISFVVEGWSSCEVVKSVDRVSDREVGIRWGSFYSNRLVEGQLGLLGKDGVVRVSLVHYNTLEEVERLIGIFEDILGPDKK